MIIDVPSASAWNPGALLWAVPAVADSPGTQRLDWHLNFQLSRAERRQSPKLSEPMISILTACKLPQWKSPVSASSCLLLETSQLLPNRWVMQVPNLPPKEWLALVQWQWDKLSRPSLRVFLPSNMERTDVTSVWKRAAEDADIGIVAEQG